jgi:hypothetical protein
MDRRLRFRHRARTAKSERATGLVGPSAALEMRRLTPQVAPVGVAEGGARSPARGAKSVGAGPREKPRSGSRARPYRRPTLVAGCKRTKGNG